ncbi:MAG: RidA family protein [Deltaproteobacteria bacterium]|nr:RidA family protein [Deltaproteobacteria bacterium]
MERTPVMTDKAPEPVGPYSQAIRAGNWLFVSGQLPIDPKTGESASGSFERQVRRALENLKAIIEAGGSDLDRVVKVTVYLTDMERFAELNAVYDEYFGDSRPARVCIEVRDLPRGAPLEIEAIAFCD